MCTQFSPHALLGSQANLFTRSEIAVYEHRLLKFDSTSFLLSMVFRDGMLPGFSTQLSCGSNASRRPKRCLSCIRTHRSWTWPC